MELKDYNNLTAVLIGIGVIAICLFLYYLAQLYFKSCAGQINQKIKKP